MNALFIAWLLLLAGALLAPAVGGKKRTATAIGGVSAVLGSACGLLAAGRVLLSGESAAFSMAWTMPGGSLSFNLDGLAAFFLAPIFLIGLAGAVYGSEYMRNDDQRLPGLHWSYYNLLLLAMSLVVTAANSLLFLFAWECMSLSSFFLVIHDHRQEEVRQAGWTYLIATHLGAALLFGFFLYAGAVAGSFEFSAFAALGNLALPAASALFVLILAGFGSKAGFFPLHVWLPEAHPAAPSHVSALMSGVMVKTAVYGILRFLTFMPPAPAWWGGLLMTAGITGAMFGIAMAALQRDMKRSLAYSTVENIGIIFLALGFWLYAGANGQQLAAWLALTGGLLHVWNHALFKGLLFLGAGSLLHGTGTRNLDRMGGLLRRMPFTGLAFVAGSMAVAALPPLNGLVGEWFIYSGFLETGYRLNGLAGFLPLVLIGLLALVGGMVLIVFTRFIGIALAGEARHETSKNAHESGWRMVGPMFLLAILCLAGGLVPALLIRPAGRATSIIDINAAALPAADNFTPLWLGRVGGLLLVLVLSAYLVSRWRRQRDKVAASATWGCGFSFPSARMSYTAEGYTELAQTGLLCGCLRPQVSGGRPVTLFPGAVLFAQESADPVLMKIFLPFFRWAAGRCTRLRLLQSGILHIYLLYIFIATTLLLYWVAFQ